MVKHRMKNIFYAIKCFFGFHDYKTEIITEHFFKDMEDYAFTQCAHCGDWYME